MQRVSRHWNRESIGRPLIVCGFHGYTDRLAHFAKADPWLIVNREEHELGLHVQVTRLSPNACVAEMIRIAMSEDQLALSDLYKLAYCSLCFVGSVNARFVYAHASWLSTEPYTSQE